MDNRTMDVVSLDHDDLDSLIEIIFKNAPGGKASHYRILRLKEKTQYLGSPTENHYSEYVEDQDGIETMVFYWATEKEATAFPVPCSSIEAAFFAKMWLKSVDFGKEPDVDGSCDKGFRIFTDKNWGMVAGSHYGIFAVQPHWAMYGK